VHHSVLLDLSSSTCRVVSVRTRDVGYAHTGVITLLSVGGKRLHGGKKPISGRSWSA
jgi:hypothetical protein